MIKDEMRKLLEPDYDKIYKYIRLYSGASFEAGMDNFLMDWYDSKGKLFRLLGNELKKSFPIDIKKDDAMLLRLFVELIGEGAYDLDDDEYYAWNVTEPFCSEYISFIKEAGFASPLRSALTEAVNPKTLKDDCFSFDCYYNKVLKFQLDGHKHEFRVNSGMKPLKFLNKFVEYCGRENFPHFEEFRIKHSLVFNDKVIKGTINFSIHPLDFMTMSDNANNWQSCMNWKQDGCYRIGTQEMMNSNNVIVAYLASDTVNLEFGDCIWNSKKWRQLFYVTKPIIVSGKSYPYENADLSKTLVGLLRDLAKENLGWKYEYDIAEYKDMRGMDYREDMDNLRRHDDKKTIFFDCNGMYNDMLNDDYRPYWCVRNKVKHALKISYSGKARCLDCGKIRILNSEADDDDYAEDSGFDKFVCDECYSSKKCAFCGTYVQTNRGYSDVYCQESGCCDYIEKVRVCPTCARRYIRCGSCLEWTPNWGLLAYDPDGILNEQIEDNEDITLLRRAFELASFDSSYSYADYQEIVDGIENFYLRVKNSNVKFVILCRSCFKKVKYPTETNYYRRGWRDWRIQYLNPKIADEEFFKFLEKYSYSNVEVLTDYKIGEEIPSLESED